MSEYRAEIIRFADRDMANNFGLDLASEFDVRFRIEESDGRYSVVVFRRAPMFTGKAIGDMQQFARAWVKGYAQGMEAK